MIGVFLLGLLLGIGIGVLVGEKASKYIIKEVKNARGRKNSC